MKYLFLSFFLFGCNAFEHEMAVTLPDGVKKTCVVEIGPEALHLLNCKEENNGASWYNLKWSNYEMNIVIKAKQ